jgi:metallo-beta-lactamase family protein
VNAAVEIINSYSAHADYSELIRFLSCQNKEEVKTVFLVHGEMEAKLAFMKKLNDQGYKKVVIPEKGEEIKLNE